MEGSSSVPTRAALAYRSRNDSGKEGSFLAAFLGFGDASERLRFKTVLATGFVCSDSEDDEE